MISVKQSSFYAVVSCEINDEYARSQVLFSCVKKSQAIEFLRELRKDFERTDKFAETTKTTGVFSFEVVTEHSRIAYDLCEVPPLALDPHVIY